MRWKGVWGKWQLGVEKASYKREVVELKWQKCPQRCDVGRAVLPALFKNRLATACGIIRLMVSENRNLVTALWRDEIRSCWRRPYLMFPGEQCGSIQLMRFPGSVPWATSLLSDSIFFLSQTSFWQALDKRLLMTQHPQSDSKCVIKCFVNPGSFLINIHMLFAVAVRSRYRHCEPMFITSMLFISPWPPPWGLKPGHNGKGVHFHPSGESFPFHGKTSVSHTWRMDYIQTT